MNGELSRESPLLPSQVRMICRGPSPDESLSVVALLQNEMGRHGDPPLPLLRPRHPDGSSVPVLRAEESEGVRESRGAGHYTSASQYDLSSGSYLNSLTD